MRTHHLLRALAIATLVFWQSHLEAGERDTGRQWAATLKRTAAQLADGDFGDALNPLRKLSEEMFGRLSTNPANDRSYALVITQLALAEAGTNNLEAAIWHWQTAQNIDRDLSGVDLAAFGEAGRILSEHRLPPKPEKCGHRPDDSPPPVVAERREPRFPEGARLSKAGGIVIVHVQIDEDGRTSEPQVMKPGPATLVFSTLEALRDWRFEPYFVDGVATPTTFCVTFNFKPVR